MTYVRCASCGQNRWDGAGLEGDPLVCTDTVECAKRERIRLRVRVPEDAESPGLRESVRGECRWCGTPVYRVDKTGRVVIDYRRCWHEGRVVHPDAEPEPPCTREYNRLTPFTFRDAVFKRDRGVCAECGYDYATAMEEWYASRPNRWDEEYFESTTYEERSAAHDAWLGRRPRDWHADHIVPLEDGGEHLMANAQTLCADCHVRKTAEENRARARKRRAVASGQERMEV